MGAEFNVRVAVNSESVAVVCSASALRCCSDMSSSSSKSNKGSSASSQLYSLRRLDALEADFKAFRRRTNERLGELESCVEDVKSLVDNLPPNQEELQTYVQVLADKVQWRRTWGEEGAIAPPITRVEGHREVWMGMDGAPENQQILAIDYRKHPRF